MGKLRLDRSTRADVVAWLGTPVRDVSGRFDDGNGDEPAHDALTYRCGAACASTFYINTTTRRLAALATSSRSYAGPLGLRIGMSTAEAERRTHHRAVSGCLTGFYLGAFRMMGKRAATIWVDIAGSRTTARGRVYGGRVNELEIESNRHPVSLLNC